MHSAFTLRVADWHDPKDQEQLKHIRDVVFVQEQKVPVELEMDEYDAVSLHALALGADGQPLGTGRLLSDGKIGRMAVMRQARGTGVGRALLEFLVEQARERGHKRVRLGAQVHAIAFYEKSGFEAYGEIYLDAGIDHRWMQRSLK